MLVPEDTAFLLSMTRDCDLVGNSHDQTERRKVTALPGGDTGVHLRIGFLKFLKKTNWLSVFNLTKSSGRESQAAVTRK